MSSRAWVAGAFLLAAISAAPPKQVVLETIGDLKAWAPKILEQVVWDRNMPVGNESGMTEEERALLARWIETPK